jgi:AcrR family transcriptional regulator
MTERRGRQAEAARNDLRVLAAAREVFAAQGADAPVSAIAERAGVGIGSLYRRYGSKDDLLRELCLIAMRQSVALAQDALAVRDPWQGLTSYIRAAVAASTGALAPLAGAIETTPEMWEVSRQGRALLERLVTQAQAAGVLRPDVTPLDVAWLIEMFGGLGPVAPSTEDAVIRQRLLALALDGLRPGAGDTLPGSPPTQTYYESRWRLLEGRGGG